MCLMMMVMMGLPLMQAWVGTAVGSRADGWTEGWRGWWVERGTVG